MSAEFEAKLAPGIESIERLFVLCRTMFGTVMVHSTQNGLGWCAHSSDEEHGCTEATVLAALLHLVLEHSDLDEERLGRILFPG